MLPLSSLAQYSETLRDTTIVKVEMGAATTANSAMTAPKSPYSWVLSMRPIST